MVRLIFSLPILLFAMVLNNHAQSREIPKGWKEINECGASFLVPKGMKRERDKAIPIDSCFATFKNSALKLGLSNDNYAPEPEETSYESIEIDGNKARLIVTPNYLKIYTLFIEATYPRFTFAMSITFKKPDDAQTARQIFQSIRFVQGE